MTSHLRRRRKYDEKTSGRLSDPAEGDPLPRVYIFAYFDPASTYFGKVCHHFSCLEMPSELSMAC